MPSRAFSSVRRSASVFWLASSVAAVPLLSGCDNPTHTADLAVEAKIASAQSNPDRAAANTDLDAAAKESTASPVEKLKAKALLANNELETAQGLAADIARREAVIDRIASEIVALGSQIQANNARVAALKLYDPVKVQDSIKDKSTAITGSDDKPDWYKTDAGSLDSLAVNDKQATALQQQISQLQDTVKTETDQRTKLLADADKLSEQSEREQGQKSVDTYVEGSNDRKKAADLTTKLDQDNVLLGRAQSDLALRQGQQDSLKGSIKLMGDRSAAVDDRWKAVQAEIDAINTASKTLAGDESAGSPADATTDDVSSGATLALKAAAIDALVKKNHSERALALTHFDSAIGFYKDASGFANDFKRDVSARLSLITDPQKPEHDLFQEQLNWLDPTTYRYMQGDVALQKAEFFARRADEEKTRLDLATNLKPMLDPAQLPVPTTLTQEDLDSGLKDTQKLAREAFADAIDQFKNIQDGASQPEIKSAAGIQLIFAYYASSILEASANDGQKAADQLNLAKEKVEAAQADNVYVPGLPGELAIAPVPAPGGTMPQK